MPGLLYPATVPHFLQMLPQMVALVGKAEAHCEQTGMAPETLLDARLAGDMWNLTMQFRSCWSQSADAVDSALSGRKDVDYTEPPADFGVLRERLTGAIARLRAVAPSDLERVQHGEVKISAGEHRLTFAVPDYLVHYALPHFYFHCTIAYAILRNQGLAIGKADFLGPLPLRT